jgi:type IV secretion system protein VirD4
MVDPDGKGVESHWQKTSKALLEGCILHLLYKSAIDGTPANMSALDAMLADSKRPISELWAEMVSTKHFEGATHPGVARAAQDMIDRPEEEAGSVLSTAKSYLSLYRDPIIEKNTDCSDFKIYDLMNYDTPVSLYIITQPTDKDRLKPLVRILLNMIIRVQASDMVFEKSKSGARLGKGNYKYKQLLMIDEFPSLGKLDIMQESLAFIAGYGMKCYLICQDINQLTSRDKGYGRDETITSNCHIQNAYPPNRQETAEHLSKLVGTTTVTKENISTSGKLFGAVLTNVNKSLQEVQRPLLTPDECRNMPGPQKDGDMIVEGGDMLIFAAGFPAIYGKQPLYFKDKILSARSTVDPPEVSDQLTRSEGTIC